MKKLLSILLVVMLMITSMPLSIFNITASAKTSGYYIYVVSNGEATITDISSSISGDITVPSILGGYPVTSIGNSALRRKRAKIKNLKLYTKNSVDSSAEFFNGR